MDKIKMLSDLIKEHTENKCECDLRDEGKGLCLAGEYLSGCRTLQDVLEDLN